MYSDYVLYSPNASHTPPLSKGSENWTQPLDSIIIVSSSKTQVQLPSFLLKWGEINYYTWINLQRVPFLFTAKWKVISRTWISYLCGVNYIVLHDKYKYDGYFDKSVKIWLKNASVIFSGRHYGLHNAQTCVTGSDLYVFLGTLIIL